MPSKRARKIPEKIQVSKDDLNELQNSPEPTSDVIVNEQEDDVSIDELKDQETSDNSDVDTAEQ